MKNADWWRTGPFSGGEGAEAGLRREAGLILRAGIAAADPEEAVIRALSRRVAGIEAARRVFILALGKAADGMARGAVAVLADRLSGGVVVGPPPGEPADARLVRLSGDHPVPGPASQSAGEAVHALTRGVREGDAVVCLISGGASALVTRPVAGVTLADIAGLTAGLLRAGAAIGEVNAVRRRLDALKGGRLATALARARVLGLLVSDVPGDRPADIGSGPLVPEPTGSGVAREILERYGLLAATTGGVRRALDAPAGDPPPVDVEIVASADLARAAASAEAVALGHAVISEAHPVAGEARLVGKGLGKAIRSGAGRRAIVRAGETTVTVTGTGRGGRNQEVALGAVGMLAGSGPALVAAMGTDGIDGPTDAAGAVATSSSAARAAAAGLDAAAALADNDAYPYFARLGDLIVSGATGTNVMDLYIALAEG